MNGEDRGCTGMGVKPELSPEDFGHWIKGIFSSHDSEKVRIEEKKHNNKIEIYPKQKIWKHMKNYMKIGENENPNKYSQIKTNPRENI